MLESILNLFYPRSCPICGRPSDRPRRFICAECLNRLPPAEFGAAAILYEVEGRDIIHRFKFHGAQYLTEDLADLLEAAMRIYYRFSRIDLVIPIPIHFVRRLTRGYNQSELLARSLAKRLDRTMRADILKRVGLPRQQARLSAQEREENVKGSFKVVASTIPYLIGRRVLLVDDVYTTGATMAEAKKTLMEAGAREVLPLTLARVNE